MNLELVSAVVFYSIIAILIYFNRKKIKILSKVIISFPSKRGIKLMDRLGKRKKLFKILSTISLPIAIYFMAVVVFQVAYGAYYIFTTPDAPATVAFVIPGVRIPGSAMFFPFWYTIIALVVIATIHEFSHGIVAVSEGIPIKEAGFGLFLIFFIAFVEPDEKKMGKASKLARIRVASAGPVSNIITAFLVSLLFVAIDPLLSRNINYNGVLVNSVELGLPANLSGLSPGMVIQGLDNRTTPNMSEFSGALLEKKPNQTVLVSTDSGNFELNLTGSPSNSNAAYMGIIIEQSWEFSRDNWISRAVYWVFGLPYYRNGTYDKGLLGWIALLSLFVGMMNLLPVFLVDGGIILMNLLGYAIKNEKLLKKVAFTVFYLVLLLLAFNILGPLVV